MPDAIPKLRLLLIAPSNRTHDALYNVLSGAFSLELQTAASTAGLRSALALPAWDIAVYQSGASFSIQTALKIIEDQAPDLPVVLLTPPDDQNSPLSSMPAGVRDVLATDRLARLPATIARELREANQRAEHRAALEMLRDSEARFRAMVTNLPGMLFHLRRDSNGDYRFLYVSEGCQKLIGRKQQELRASAHLFFEAFIPEERHRLTEALSQSASQATLLNWEGRTSVLARSKWLNRRSMPLLLAGGGVEWQGIATNISHSKEIEEELRESRQQLAELSSHLEAVKEEERERIAHDIHDELGSILVRLKIEVSQLSKKLPDALAPLHQKAHSIEELLDLAMDTTRRVARELRPGILNEFGLPEALKCQAEDFSQRTNITCLAQCDDESIAPSSEISLTIFRIAQEALTNVGKHACASLVVMRLWRESGKILFEIRDNGRGISDEDATKPKSFGLRGIRERVLSLKGEFTIGPGEQGGTCIGLQLPEHIDVEPYVEDQPQRTLF